MSTTFKDYGKELTTVFDVPLISKDRHDLIVNSFYQLPSIEDVNKEIIAIAKGGHVIKNVTQYYFKKLMCECKRFDCKMSIYEVLNSIQFTSYIDFITLRKHNYYYPNGVSNNPSDIQNAFRQFFATAGHGVAKSISQFPLSTAQFILEKYNVNNNYYDFSCGWGSRLTAALSNNINYYGTDPNYKLTPILEAYTSHYKEIIHSNNSIVKIFTQGSEDCIPELENQIGVCFSSIPYFNLEDYKYGNQACHKMSYNEWLNEYLIPTISNGYKYLVDNGFFIINVQNYGKYELENDTIKAAEHVGFYFYDKEYLHRNIKFTGTQAYKKMDEPIFVFSKNKGVKLPGIKKVNLW